MSEALRILVVDDETPARNRMREVLTDCAASVALKVVGEASDGVSALRFMNDNPVDVALLDIRMPSMDGIEVARHAQKLERPPAIIFTTAFDAYAVKAFELNAIDYLLKPIRRERLLTALKKVTAQHNAALGAALNQVPQRSRSHLSVSERGKVILVPMNEVIYMRAELKYITVKTAVREYLIEESLTSLEEELGRKFVRVHRSCLVARDAITGFERVQPDEGEPYWVVLMRGVQEKLPISRRQQHVIREFKGD
jgi:two-component system, LytTR family, response regulator AlgR